MKIGVYQFKGSSDLSDNHEAIKRGIIKAAEAKVRLLVFQECAASGYPPVETPEIGKLDFHQLNLYLEEIRILAKKFDIYIALGTIRNQEGKHYNSLFIINPEGQIAGTYDKRALWGWDTDNFSRGSKSGIYEIDNIKVGFRICFEVRFPEYFRELFKEGVQLCFVSFCDVSDQDFTPRYEIIKAHLITRAVENVMTVASVNSISNYQTAPTAVIDSNGFVICEAPKNCEHLLVYEYEAPPVDFGARGRIVNSNQLLAIEK